MTLPALRYSGCPLDRADGRRKDPAWLAAAWEEASTRIVAVWQNHSALILDQCPPTAAPLTWTPLQAKAVLAALPDATAPAPLFLGVAPDGPAWFALDFSDLADEAARDAVVQAPGLKWGDLRGAGMLLDAPTAAILAYARGLAHWHRSHRHCGHCGAAMASHQGGHVLRCTAVETCGRETYPRTDPAVIMLVVDEDTRPPRALLGRDPRWPAGVYSTLAGFVEPGESLEEAVVREVWEEAGIRIRDARYIASQPWPFPRSLMLGFRAIAETTSLHLDRTEVEDALWVTAAELRSFGLWGDPDAARALPRQDSIARFLIAQWAGEQGISLKG